MLKAKDQKILDEMKDKIKKLPLEEKIPAVAIYRLTEDYFKQLAVEEAEEEKLDKDYRAVEAQVLLENQAIITGARACTPEELAGLNQFLKEGETTAPEHNAAKPIDKYWQTVLKNSGICKDLMTIRRFGRS